MSQLAIGIDVGGTKVEGALVDPLGNEIRSLRQPSPKDRESMYRMIKDMVRTLMGLDKILGLGFSIPGSIDPETHILRNAPNSPAINGRDLQLDLQLYLNYTMQFENDANCMLLSEHKYGAARGAKRAMGIILGTGVGGALIEDGKLFKGSHGLAPEPGHLPLDINGRVCACGNRGCAEAYLSGRSILKRFKELGGGAYFARSIFRRKREPASMAVLAETAHYYARFMAMMVSIYDPDLFVLGGGMSRQPFFYQQEKLISRFLFGTRKVPPILPAQGGDASGKLGAAVLVFNRYKVSTEPVVEVEPEINADNIWGY